MLLSPNPQKDDDDVNDNNNDENDDNFFNDDVDEDNSSNDDDDNDDDGDIEFDDCCKYDGQHNPPSVGNSTDNVSDTEHEPNASTEELYQQCLGRNRYMLGTTFPRSKSLCD